ncbi:MAG: DNA polymerase III subunit gamma/tau, partial [Pseudomonadota bacterium]
PSDWIERTRAMAQKVTPAQAARYWQILLSGYGVAQTAPDIAVAARMVVLRLVAAANLPSPEDAARQMASGGREASAAPGKPHAKPAGAPAIASLEDVVALMDTHREAILSGDVSKYVRPVSVQGLTVTCELKPDAPSNLLVRMADFLKSATGENWTVERGIKPAETETLQERQARLKAEKIASAAAHPAVKAALDLFPGAQITDVRLEDSAADADKGNIIDMAQKRAARG